MISYLRYAKSLANLKKKNLQDEKMTRNFEVLHSQSVEYILRI